MRRRTLVTLATLALLGAGAQPSAAQQAQMTRPGVMRLAWGTVNVLVIADSTQGVEVWAATVPRAEDDERRPFVARFAPDAVERWGERVAAVLAAEGPPPDKQAVLLALLPSVDSPVVAVARRQAKGKWKRDVVIYFDRGDGKEPLLVRGRPADARAFAQSLLTVAAMSALRAGAGVASGALPCPEAPADTRWCAHARPHPDNPHPRFPPTPRFGVGIGEVWVRFEVDSTGRVAMDTFEVLLSDGEPLTRAVRDVIPSWRFEPARRDGRPVRERQHYRYVLTAVVLAP